MPSFATPNSQKLWGPDVRRHSLIVEINKLTQQRRRFLPKRLGDLAKFDHVEPSFASLYLRHEALRLAQTSREFDLREIGGSTRGGDKADKLLMPVREDR